jgi:hypothetical protein
MMKRVGLLILACLFLPLPAHALCNGLLGSELTPFAFETLTVSTTAKKLTATVWAPNGVTATPVAKVAIITVEANPLRWRADGVAPTSSTGILVAGAAAPAQPSQIEVCGQAAFLVFQMIRQGAADSTIMVQYFQVGQ